MSTVLDRIVAATRRGLVSRMRTRPAARIAAQPTGRSLRAALRADRRGLILECKRRSPSAGVLRPDYDPAAIARAYRPYAAAISVLTEPRFFGGSLDHLRQVRAEVDLPLLSKDFILDRYQVLEAREAGADAVLLLCSVLDDPQLAELRQAAAALGMEALIEVHDERELDRALALGAELIGINNRDLSTLAVSLETTERLAPRVPREVVRVAESGVRDQADLRRLAPLVDGFLVGTSLMGRRDLDRALRELTFGRVKICGLTRAEDAEAAWRAGATWGGLIFAGESPRAVSVEQARAVRQAAPLRWVGVFVNEDPARVASLARALDLAAVQLHGEEPPDEVSALRPLLPAGCEIWKAVRVRQAIPAVSESGADRLLLDAHASGRRGGSGQRFDWALLEGYAERERVILAGGLAPDNIAAAAALGVWALDVNSGVERAAGIKSRERLAALFDALGVLPRRG